MTIENKVRAYAGIFILVSLVMYLYVSPYWLWVTAFIGASLLQSAFTGICPLAILLKKSCCGCCSSSTDEAQK